MQAEPLQSTSRFHQLGSQRCQAKAADVDGPSVTSAIDSPKT